MSTKAPIRVLLADDHPMMRSALVSMIRGEPEMMLVGQASNGRQAVDLFNKLQPDVTLMDINMPEMNGLEAIELIRDRYPAARIIVLTNYDSDEDVFQGLQAGAVGYILKDTPPDRLLQTIQAVHAGYSQIPPELSERLERRKILPKLSPREISVLRLIKAGKSNRAIGVTLQITESTVKSHVKNILIKMGVSDRTQAVTQAIQRGILNLDE